MGSLCTKGTCALAICMEKIRIGKITSPSGLKGEVRVYSYSGDPARFESLDRVFVDGKEMAIEGLRYQKNMIVLKLEGIDGIDQAERLRGKYIDMAEEDLPELPEGEFYIRDLLGMKVVHADTGEELGFLKDVLTDRPQDIYVVGREGGEDVLIPGVLAFVPDIDPVSRRIFVRPIEGMF